MRALVKKILHYALGKHKIRSREQLIQALEKTKYKQMQDMLNNGF